MTGEWGWKDGWFSEAGLLAATEDQRESTEAEKGGGGGLWDGGEVASDIVESIKDVGSIVEFETQVLADDRACCGNTEAVASGGPSFDGTSRRYRGRCAERGLRCAVPCESFNAKVSCTGPRCPSVREANRIVAGGKCVAITCARVGESSIETAHPPSGVIWVAVDCTAAATVICPAGVAAAVRGHGSEAHDCSVG